MLGSGEGWRGDVAEFVNQYIVNSQNLVYMTLFATMIIAFAYFYTDWSDREAVIDYLVEAERPFAARSRQFDEAAVRELMGRVVDRSTNLEWGLANSFAQAAGEPWR